MVLFVLFFIAKGQHRGSIRCTASALVVVGHVECGFVHLGLNGASEPKTYFPRTQL